MIDKINSKYQHQLYFLDDKSKEIRAYFQKLSLLDINNNNNNNVQQSEFEYNYGELSQKIAVITQNSKNYNSILSMLKTDEALKVIVALLFKGFGWRNEIYETFNISSNLYVQNTFGTLQKLNLLDKEKGIKLNPYFYEALEKTKDTNLRKSLFKADLVFINDNFIKFCSLLKDLFEFKVRTASSFKFSLKSIIEDSKHFSNELNYIMEEETTLNTRKHFQDGIYFETETLKSKKFETDIKETLQEIKLEKLECKEKSNLLTNKEAGDLAIYRDSKKDLTLFSKQDEEIFNFKKSKKPISTYNGVECDVDLILRNQKKQDKKIENSKTIIGNQELIKEIPKTLGGEIISGYYLSEKVRNEIIESQRPKSESAKCEDFLSSLGGLAE